MFRSGMEGGEVADFFDIASLGYGEPASETGACRV